MKERAQTNSPGFKIDWFHLGADLESGASDSVEALPPDLGNALGDRLTFLMVGTVEPRKGHAQSLAAFEELWRGGVDANLVIVGKPGWMNDKTTQALRSHPEKGARLHWFESAPDDVLAALYQRADALIALMGQDKKVQDGKLRFILARGIGKSMGEFKRAREDFEREIHNAEVEPPSKIESKDEKKS